MTGSVKHHIEGTQSHKRRTQLCRITSNMSISIHMAAFVCKRQLCLCVCVHVTETENDSEGKRKGKSDPKTERRPNSDVIIVSMTMRHAQRISCGPDKQ